MPIRYIPHIFFLIISHLIYKNSNNNDNDNIIYIYIDNDNNDNNNTSILYDIIYSYIYHISYSLFILTVPSRDSGLAHSAHTWPNSSSASGSPVATPRWELEPPAAGGSRYGVPF